MSPAEASAEPGGPDTGGPAAGGLHTPIADTGDSIGQWYAIGARDAGDGVAARLFLLDGAVDRAEGLIGDMADNMAPIEQWNHRPAEGADMAVCSFRLGRVVGALRLAAGMLAEMVAEADALNLEVLKVPPERRGDLAADDGEPL